MRLEQIDIAICSINIAGLVRVASAASLQLERLKNMAINIKQGQDVQLNLNLITLGRVVNIVNHFLVGKLPLMPLFTGETLL